METTVKLVNGMLLVPAAAAACSYLALRLAEQIICRLVGLVIERAISVVLWFCELLVSQLDAFVTQTVLP